MKSETLDSEFELNKENQWGNNFVVIVSKDAPVVSVNTKTQWGDNFVINVKVKNLEHADEIAEKVANTVMAKMRREVPFGKVDRFNTAVETLGRYPINVVNRLLKSIRNSPLWKALE